MIPNLHITLCPIKHWYSFSYMTVHVPFGRFLFRKISIFKNIIILPLLGVAEDGNMLKNIHINTSSVMDILLSLYVTDTEINILIQVL